MAGFLLMFPSRLFAESNIRSGHLLCAFTQGERSDFLPLPNLALHVPTNQPPSGLLDPGPFTAEFSGWISVELRAQYTFRAELNGALDLAINGKPVLNITGEGGVCEPSKPLRLNKGTNSVIARFSSPKTGPAFLRVFWAAKTGAAFLPIPSGAFAYDQNAAVENAMKLRDGGLLAARFRCLKCHLAAGFSYPELDMDAPALTGIGSRLRESWIETWLLNPAAHRAGARMPRLFFGGDARAKARAVAGFLASLVEERHERPPSAPKAEGASLFKALMCGQCHTLAEGKGVDGKLPLGHTRDKFLPGALAAYLRDPRRHYRWNPMPSFKLSGPEAEALEEFLGVNPAGKSGRATPAEIALGKELVQAGGCLNCHALPIENKYSAPAFSKVLSGNPRGGCLATEPADGIPKFSFQAGELEVLRAFVAAKATRLLETVVPSEFALRQIESLGCARCHSDPALPRLELIGGKLQPEWCGRFLGGQIPYKPRPWLEARMPVFPAEANLLAAGLAGLHGHAPRTPPSGPINLDLARTGAKLVSAAGGFSCVACHGVGNFAGGMVVESPGINLAHGGERLLESYFHRWILNPLGIDPTTKMPAFFDEQGRSQLIDILEGDGPKQIDAIWEYVRLGWEAPPPPSP